MRSRQFLLLQVRNADDPMKIHEVAAFARALAVPANRISVFDLLRGSLHPDDLAKADVLLLGGSGDYSAAGEGEWLNRTLDSLRLVHDLRKPTFASCWGFQAMARAMGGRVINDVPRAEVGTLQIHLTENGHNDPVYSDLAPSFWAQMGHEDHVVELPRNTTHLAYSDKVRYQAYRFDNAPIYCTQFHPELNREDLLTRIAQYPRYIEKIAGVPLEEFRASLRDTTASEGILKRFVMEFC